MGSYYYCYHYWTQWFRKWLVFWKWFITCLPNMNYYGNLDAKNRCSFISRMTQFNWLKSRTWEYTSIDDFQWFDATLLPKMLTTTCQSLFMGREKQPQKSKGKAQTWNSLRFFISNLLMCSEFNTPTAHCCQLGLMLSIRSWFFSAIFNMENIFSLRKKLSDIF